MATEETQFQVSILLDTSMKVTFSRHNAMSLSCPCPWLLDYNDLSSGSTLLEEEEKPEGLRLDEALSKARSYCIF